MAKSFVKAIYDYDSNEAEDLSFKAGAVIRVVDCVDDNWIKGEHNGKVGLFPGNFVEPTFTGFDAAETTIVAKETYISGEDGVLTFFRGDRITFLGFVDDYWCRGRFGSEVGLFPAFAVDGLDELSSIPANKTSAETTPTGNQESNILPRENNGEPCAESLYEFKGLSSDELSFPAGEIILLSKDIDLEWFEGSHNGKTGLFPKSFVNVLKPLIKVPSTNVPETPVPYAVAVYPYVGETSTELSFREGDIIYLHCWVSPEWIEGEINGKTGIFPSSFVQIQVELPHEFQDYSNCKAEWLKRNGVKDSGIEQTENSSFKVSDKAVAIYSFSTNVKGDLSLEVGDLINIERIIDDEWIEGRRNDAEVGLCPAVFLELQEGISKSSPETERSNLAGRSEISTSTRAMPNQPESYPCTEIMNNSIKMGNIASIDSEIETSNICSADQNPLLNVTQSTSQITKTSSAQILDDANMTNHSVTSRKIITGGITGDDNNVSEKPTATKPLPSPKPAITAKPSILPKPAFLKNTQKPVTAPKTLNSNKVVERENVVSFPPSVLPSDHPGEAVGQNINAIPEKLGVVGKIEQNSSTQENDLEAKQQKATADGHVHPLVYNRVMFEDQEESYSPTIQTVSNLGTTSLQKTSNHSSNLAFSPRNVPPDESHNSCKSLFDESLDDGLPPPLHPKPIFGENPPEPPPRLDLLCSKHSEGSTSDALSSKLAQQADEFEKSHHPKKSSPSLNELRAASQKSNVQRPVPARRNKPPSSLSSHHIDIDPGMVEAG